MPGTDEDPLDVRAELPATRLNFPIRCSSTPPSARDSLPSPSPSRDGWLGYAQACTAGDDIAAI